MKVRVNERVHFVHYVCELSISIFLKPGIFAYNKPALSLNSVPALSEHVFFLLLTFFLQGRIVRVYGFVAFRQHIDDGLLQFCLYLFKRVFSNEVVNIPVDSKEREHTVQNKCLNLKIKQQQFTNSLK